MRAGLAVQVARPLTQVDAALGRIRNVLLAVVLAGIGLATVLGLAVARDRARAGAPADGRRPSTSPRPAT